MTDSEQVHATLHGLHEWFKHTFEKAGWMVLAHQRSSNDKTYQSKLDSYVEGINRLTKYLQARSSNPRGNNTIEKDFPVMIKNLGHLSNFVTSLRTQKLSDVSTPSGKNLAVKDMTLCAMQHYYRHVFEKYGWMVLTKAKLNNGDYKSQPDLEKHKQKKLKLYGESLDILSQSLNHRIETTTDLDKDNVKVDLESMIRNVNVLKSCFNEHLMKSDNALDLSVTSPVRSDSARRRSSPSRRRSSPSRRRSSPSRRSSREFSATSSANISANSNIPSEINASPTSDVLRFSATSSANATAPTAVIASPTSADVSTIRPNVQNDATSSFIPDSDAVNALVMETTSNVVSPQRRLSQRRLSQSDTSRLPEIIFTASETSTSQKGGLSDYEKIAQLFQ